MKFFTGSLASGALPHQVQVLNPQSSHDVRKPTLHGMATWCSPCCYYSVTKLCLTLCNPVDYSPSGSSVHGISQARIKKLVAICFSRAIFPTRGSNPCVSCIGRWILCNWAPREAVIDSPNLNSSRGITQHQLWFRAARNPGYPDQLNLQIIASPDSFQYNTPQTPSKNYAAESFPNCEKN